jgi:hypothetical protein
VPVIFVYCKQLILKIRRSADFIHTLAPAEQRAARDAYALGLKSVYVLAAVATLLAYLARLPVRVVNHPHESRLLLYNSVK